MKKARNPQHRLGYLACTHHLKCDGNVVGYECIVLAARSAYRSFPLCACHATKGFLSTVCCSCYLFLSFLNIFCSCMCECVYVYMSEIDSIRK